MRKSCERNKKLQKEMIINDADRQLAEVKKRKDERLAQNAATICPHHHQHHAMPPYAQQPHPHAQHFQHFHPQQHQTYSLVGAQNMNSRIQSLETHVEEISTGLLQNKKELERKFKHVDILQASHADTLGAHDQGLRNHHDTLQRMGSDLRMQRPATTQGAVTLAPSAPQKQLSINELNAMACNF
jgi:hypothetical protein